MADDEDVKSLIGAGAAAVPGGGVLKELLETSFRKISEQRKLETWRRMTELLAVYEDRRTADDPSAAIWLEKLVNEDERGEILLRHLEDLVREVVPEVRAAYLVLAVDSLSGAVGYAFARDMAIFLKSLSAEEAKMLCHLMAVRDDDQVVRDKVRNGISLAERRLAERVFQKLTFGGFAGPRLDGTNSINPESAWGIQFLDGGYLGFLESYVEKIRAGRGTG